MEREHIIVGYNGSASATVAVRWAARWAVQQHRPLTVVHAAGPEFIGPAGSRLPETPAVTARSVTARSVLGRGMDCAREAAKGADVRGEFWNTHPAECLIAMSKGAAALVLGTRTPTELAAIALGSITRPLSTHAHCPVILVHEGDELPGPDHPVVVGADGSGHAEAAVQFAADAAAAASAPLIVVSAYRSAARQAWTGTALRTLAEAPADDASLEREGQVSFDTLVREVGERPGDEAVRAAAGLHPELTIEESVLEGSPVHALTEVASRAGLLVVGSTGRSAVAGLILGSVSHAVIRGAPCAVAVVRPRR